ncbi:hypothetical protein ACLOJK_019773 [Asimina triloba]
MLFRLCHNRCKSHPTQRRRIGGMGKRKQLLMEAGSSLQHRRSRRLQERGRDRDESKAPSIVERRLRRYEHSKDCVVVIRLCPDLHYSRLQFRPFFWPQTNPVFLIPLLGLSPSLVYVRFRDAFEMYEKMPKQQPHFEMQFRMYHPPEGGDVPSIVEAVDDSGEGVACCGELNIAEL